MNIGIRISKLRASYNWNQDDLANKIHVSRQTISNWENNKSYPDIQSLVLLSDIFQLSLDELIKGDLIFMKRKILQNRLQRIILGIFLITLATYFCLFIFKYSDIYASLLIGALSASGLILIYIFIKVTSSAKLNNFKQTVQYLKGQDLKTVKRSSRKNLLLQYLIGGILGLSVGLFLTYLIFKFALHINLF